MPYEYLIKRHKGSKCFLKLQDHETKNTQPKNVKMTNNGFDNIRFEIWKQIKSDEVHIFLKTSFEFTSKSYSVLGWPWFFILFQILGLLFPCLVVLVANGITDRRMKIIIEFLFKNVYLCGSGLEGLNFLFIWSLKRWLILIGFEMFEVTIPDTKQFLRMNPNWKYLLTLSQLWKSYFNWVSLFHWSVCSFLFLL